MKPPLFEYHAPASVDEAVGLLAEHGDEAKVLAGGQTPVPLLSLRLARPAHIVDVNGLSELASISNGSGLEVGALVRHRVAERSADVASGSPLMATALHYIGHAAIRNRGTIGGSIAHADPAAELPAVLLALGGEVVAQSAKGSRTIAAADLFEGFLTTSLQPDELVTAVRLPASPGASGSSFQEFSRRSGDFAIIGVAVSLSLDGTGKIAEAAMAFSGAAGTPVRGTAGEAALRGQRASAELWKSAAEAAAADLDPPDDLHGSAAYRRHLASVLAARALQEAYDRAKGAS